MTSLWGQYLFVGVLLTATDIVLPVGVGRDALYCLVVFSAAAAMAVGTRRNRPAEPVVWYLISAAMGSWALGCSLHTWFEATGQVDAGASLADVFCLATYPLVVAGVLWLAHSRGEEVRPTALLDSGILMVGIGLLSWVFVIEPVFSADHRSTLSGLVNAAYPLGNVLLFGALVRFTKAPGTGRTVARVLAVVLGAMLVLQSLAQAAALAPSLDVRPSLLEPKLLLAFVLAGAEALHPLRRTFSALPLTRPESATVGQLVALAGALLIGPGILAGELIAGVPLHAGPVVVASGVLVLLVLMRMVRMLRRLRDQTVIDDLTGLPNRRDLCLQATGRLADRRGRRQALLMLDLDRFKEVNDSLGHHVGDELLIQVGVRLGKDLRAGDLLVRLGGDEFAILLENAGADEALALAHRLCATVSEPFALVEVTVHSAVSVGIALFPDHGTDLSTLLRKADIAMYKAKASGEPHIYDDTDDERATRLSTVDDLRTAVTSDQVVVHYQPKIDLDTGDIRGVEALVRWEHPTRGLVFPDDFLSLVEESGLMPALTRTVLALALDQAATWHAQGRHLSVAINLSATSLTDTDLPEQVAAMLAARDLPPQVLQLEITEDFLMADLDQARAILTRLREDGIQISIDDFGTGYNSLSYLRDLPIDELKLDRSFIFPMADDVRAATLVASTIALAHSLDLRMVAEGVETAAVYAELTRLGCDQAQGYFMSRPLPADELDEWFQDRVAADADLVVDSHAP